MRRLIVIAGPIGSGKSTTADRLTRVLASRGLATADVDLDVVAFMQRGGLADVAEFWRRGAVATAGVVRRWFDLGVDVVVAHGPFFESDGYAALLGGLEADVAVSHVLLTVSFESALARVSLDPDRAISRDPDFLRRTHEHYATIAATLPMPDFRYDTDSIDAGAVAEEVARSLIGDYE